MEHPLDEAEDLLDLEGFLALNESTNFNHFEVQHIIDETEKQIDLADEQEDELSATVFQFIAENVLKDHEARAERGAKLM